LRLNGAHQVVVYADSILGGRVHNIKKNTETILVTGKETGQEVNDGKSKCIFMSETECRTKSQQR
jgi:hypothetical protein